MVGQSRLLRTCQVAAIADSQWVHYLYPAVMAAPLLQPLRADAAKQLLLVCPHLTQPLPDPADQRSQPHEPCNLVLAIGVAIRAH